MTTMRIRDIIADEASGQLRAETDARWVQELTEKIRGEGFKEDRPLVVFNRGGVWLLIDGFHRYRAAILAGLTDVPVTVFKGTWLGALTYGVEQNKAHGMKLDPKADYKMAALKLHAAGAGVTDICDCIFGHQRGKGGARKDGYRTSHHPRKGIVENWLGHQGKKNGILRHTKKGVVGAKITAQAIEADPDLDLLSPDVTPELLIEKATKSQKAQAELEGRQKAAESIFKGLNAPVQTPPWAQTGFEHSGSHGIPVLFLSDVHAGEVVNKREMQGRNEYDWQIMERRLDKLFQTAGYLPTLLVNSRPAGIYVVLGGDMVSGDIHEELTNTNEVGPVEATERFPSLLVGHLKALADQYGNVHVKGVAGNHGRTSRKPQAKMYATTNFDWLIYKTTQKLIEASGDERFTFEFPESRDLRFDIMGRRFLLTHGDQFRGGDGMIGGIGPIMRGDVRKRTNAAFGLPLDNGMDAAYDTIMMGHWHQTIFTPYLIVNGSVKGLDEYAAAINVRQEGPAQWLFNVHPKYGIIWPNPVYL